MTYSRLWKGVSLRDPNLTREWRRWAAYLLWWVHFNLTQIGGRTPRPLAAVANLIWRRRVEIHWSEPPRIVPEPSSPFREGWARSHVFWQETVKRYRNRLCARVGRLRDRLAGQRGMGSRCDFTGRRNGILYGGSGGEINRAFEQMLASIEPSDEQKAAVAFAVDDLGAHLRGDRRSTEVN